MEGMNKTSCIVVASIPNTTQGSIMPNDPFAWFEDQTRLFHRDQRLKKVSRERLERAGTETPTRRKLADTDDTDEPGIED
jgi:hypothetical protein